MLKPGTLIKFNYEKWLGINCANESQMNEAGEFVGFSIPTTTLHEQLGEVICIKRDFANDRAYQVWVPAFQKYVFSGEQFLIVLSEG